MRQNFIVNLRLLCSYHPSVSAVGRKLGMNRQQIMKYLGGGAYPSARSMRRICDFFGVEEHEVLMPNDRFRDIVRLKPTLPLPSELTPPVVSSLLKLAARQSSQLIAYTGYYYEFRYSFTKPNLVLKSLIHVHEHDGLLLYKSIERLRRHDVVGVPPRGDVDVFKYLGLLMLVGNRIHMLDREAVMGQELSHMILFPPYRSRITTLYGMKMGVTATEAHEPIAGRVVLNKIGRHVALRPALESCGLYRQRSDGVPAAVLSYLQSDDNGHPAMLRSEAGLPR
jgi:transcriptional regulator with XRE-family HTH domain